MRRSKEQRRADRAAGIGRNGQPLPRTLGTNPKAVRAKEAEQALRFTITNELREKLVEVGSEFYVDLGRRYGISPQAVVDIVRATIEAAFDEVNPFEEVRP
jgi:hypothetical protein